MKPTSSAVAAPAAKIRSPSFSRSSSSTTTMGVRRPGPPAPPRPSRGGRRPAPRDGGLGAAAMRRGRGIVAPRCWHRTARQRESRRPPLHQPLHVLGDHVDLDVDRVPHAPAPQRRVREGGRDQRDRERGRRRPPRPSTIRRRRRSTPSRPRSATVPRAGRTSSSSSCSVGLIAVTVATPSTWPCTMWPPRRESTRAARSRFTGEPASSVAERAAAERLLHDVGREHAVERARRRSGTRR